MLLACVFWLLLQDVISGDVERPGHPEFQASDLFELWEEHGGPFQTPAVKQGAAFEPMDIKEGLQATIAGEDLTAEGKAAAKARNRQTASIFVQLYYFTRRALVQLSRDWEGLIFDFFLVLVSGIFLGLIYFQVRGFAGLLLSLVLGDIYQSLQLFCHAMACIYSNSSAMMQTISHHHSAVCSNLLSPLLSALVNSRCFIRVRHQKLSLNNALRKCLPTTPVHAEYPGTTRCPVSHVLLASPWLCLLCPVHCASLVQSAQISGASPVQEWARWPTTLAKVWHTCPPLSSLPSCSSFSTTSLLHHWPVSAVSWQPIYWKQPNICNTELSWFSQNGKFDNTCACMALNCVVLEQCNFMIFTKMQYL